MIKIYKHNKQDVYVIGDIHGRFDLLRDEIIMKDYLNNCILIIAGDCGFGFYSYDYYDKIITDLNQTLLENNIILYFVRGNHDDPSYFSEEKIFFSNAKTVQDYSIIEVGDENILCIGGGLSIDRLLRQEKDAAQKYILNFIGMSQTFYPSYWENELPSYNEEKLQELSGKGIQVSYVVSHTSPSFCFKYGSKGIESFIEYDKDLNKDLSIERGQMTLIYDKLIELRHPIKKWVYGHFHAHNEEYINNIKFVTLQHINRHADITQLI